MTRSRASHPDAHGLLMLGVVLGQFVVLAVPGNPVLRPSGCVLIAILLALAALAPSRRAAATGLVAIEGLHVVGGLLAVSGPTGKVALALFTLLAFVAAGLAGQQRARHTRRSRALLPQ